MTRQREADGLKGRFRELRGEAARPGRLPDFEAMLARARDGAAERPRLGVLEGRAWSSMPVPPFRRFLRAGAWASLAVAATVAGLLLTERRPNADAEFERLVASYSSDASGGAWLSPTSALLQVPGMDLTRSMPSIGAPVRGLDPSSLPPRESVAREENL